MHRRYHHRHDGAAVTCSTLMRVEPYASASTPSTTRRITSSCSTLMRVEPYASPQIEVVHHAWWTLAVPSCGSNPMHQHLRRQLLDGSPHLAVPSCGSNPMHRHRLRWCIMHGGHLQYPHAGRTLCISIYAVNYSTDHLILQYPHAGRT